MREIEIEKIIPTGEPFDALDTLLRAQYPVYAGMMSGGGLVRAQVTDQASEQDISAIRQAIQTFDISTRTPEQEARATTLAGIRSVAQSAVGVTYTDLTAAQVKALLGAMLFRIGAFNSDGTVRPLSEWVR